MFRPSGVAPRPYCDTLGCITYFYGTQFAKFIRTFLQRDSSPLRSAS